MVALMVILILIKPSFHFQHWNPSNSVRFAKKEKKTKTNKTSHIPPCHSEWNQNFCYESQSLMSSHSSLFPITLALYSFDFSLTCFLLVLHTCQACSHLEFTLALPFA